MKSRARRRTFFSQQIQPNICVIEPVAFTPSELDSLVTQGGNRAEEEMFFIVRGAGTLRYGDETRKIRAGDFICCPTGGPETAHQIVNDSSEPLAYISVSTMMPAEVCEYPDSGKIGSFGVGEKRLRHMTEVSASVDYWKGEV